MATYEAAAAAGYHRLTSSENEPEVNPLVGEHWIRERLLRTREFNPTQPAYLMFYPFGAHRKPRLIGVAFGMAQPVGADPPDGFEGDADGWHTHVPCANVPGINGTLTDTAGDCEAIGGNAGRGQIAMLHVWLNEPNPEGVFGADNPALPYLALGLSPPTADRLRDTAQARTARLLAQALAEAIGAKPRLTSIFPAVREPAFIAKIAPLREQIRLLIPALRAAEANADEAQYALIADSARALWQTIRAAYLDAAPTPALRDALRRWFDMTSGAARM